MCGPHLSATSPAPAKFPACCPQRLPASHQPCPRSATPETGPQSCPHQGILGCPATPGRPESIAETIQVSLGTLKLVAHFEPPLPPLRSGAHGSGAVLSQGPSGMAGEEGHSRGLWSLAFCWQLRQHGHAGKGSILSSHPPQSWVTPPHPTPTGLDP